MFGKGTGGPSNHSNGSGTGDLVRKFEALAQEAERAGRFDRAVHLYVLAFEESASGLQHPDAHSIEYLHKAWDAACSAKERALAEYVFERLEPYCSSDEVARHAEALQQMTLDKLEEFGLSRESLKDMADMVADDFAHFGGLFQVSSEALASKHASSEGAKTGESSSAALSAPAQQGEPDAQSPYSYTYKDLVGYGRAIEHMRMRGIGLDDDPHFAEFLKMLSRRHGIHNTPSVETTLFRSYAREDANRFMAATVGELGYPAVRMFMDETPQGIPVLCLNATSDIRPRSGGKGFEGPGVLVLEDIDMWGAPLADLADEYDSFTFAQLSRGAREAIMLIRSAVENPEVVVLASAAQDCNLEDFFLDLLDPIYVFDIDVPTDAERSEVWKHVASLYPSLRFIDRSDLVRLSAHMSREDIYLAAREAVEQAYGESVSKRVFVPVTRGNIFDKVAAYQPLDSAEYRELEEAAVEEFRNDIDTLIPDDLDTGGK